MNPIDFIKESNVKTHQKKFRLSPGCVGWVEAFCAVTHRSMMGCAALHPSCELGLIGVARRRAKA